jgi:hypothetical protein
LSAAWQVRSTPARKKRQFAARVEQIDGQTVELRIPSGLDHIIDASTSNIRKTLGEIAATVVDGVGGSQLESQLEVERLDIHGDDGSGTDNPRRHYYRQSDGSRAKYGKARAGLDCKGVHHRSSACLQAAAEGRQQFQWQRSRHLYQVAHGRQRVGGEGRLAKEVPVDAAAFKRVTAVQALKTEVGLMEPLTVCRVVSSTGTALTAGLIGEHDMVSDLHAFHASTEPLNHAGPFVAQDRRADPAGVAEVNVGVADATGHQAYEDLVLAGTFHFKLFDPEWTTRLAQHGGADSDYG